MESVYDRLMGEKMTLVDEMARVLDSECGEKNVVFVEPYAREDMAVGVPINGIFPSVKCFGYSSLYGVKVYLDFMTDEKPPRELYNTFRLEKDNVGTFAYLHSFMFSLDDIALMHDYIMKHFGKENTEEVMSDTDRHLLVGRRMKPTDNDYIREVETGAKGYLRGVEVIIHSKPYVKEFNGKKKLFVKALSFDSGFDYELPYKEEWLIKEV